MAALMALGELQGGALATMDDYAQRSTSLREHMRTYGSSVHCFKVGHRVAVRRKNSNKTGMIAYDNSDGTWDVILDAEFGQEEITVKTKYLEPLDELESVLYEMDEEAALELQPGENSLISDNVITGNKERVMTVLEERKRLAERNDAKAHMARFQTGLNKVLGGDQALEGPDSAAKGALCDRVKKQSLDMEQLASLANTRSQTAAGHQAKAIEDLPSVANSSSQAAIREAKPDLENHTKQDKAKTADTIVLTSDLIAQLQAESAFGLQAPVEASHWSEVQIRAFFDSDGEAVPLDIPPTHTLPNSHEPQPRCAPADDIRPPLTPLERRVQKKRESERQALRQ